MPKGSICADFAGTLDEARAFAKENGVRAPQNQPYHEARRASGCAVVTVPYASKADREAAIVKLEALGWEGCWYDRRARATAGTWVGGVRVGG